MLALEPGRVVSADRLIAGVWGEEPPNTAATALHGHVSQPAPPARRGDRHARAGYVLESSPGGRLRALSRRSFERGAALAGGDAAPRRPAREAVALRAAPRWPTSRTRRSRPRRCRGSASSASRRARSGPRPSSRSARRRELDRRAEGVVARGAAARAAARAADARALPLRPSAPRRSSATTRGGGRSSRNSASSRATGCATCTPRSCARTPDWAARRARHTAPRRPRRGAALLLARPSRRSSRGRSRRSGGRRRRRGRSRPRPSRGDGVQLIDPGAMRGRRGGAGRAARRRAIAAAGRPRVDHQCRRPDDHRVSGVGARRTLSSPPARSRSTSRPPVTICGSRRERRRHSSRWAPQARSVAHLPARGGAARRTGGCRRARAGAPVTPDGMALAGERGWAIAGDGTLVRDRRAQRRDRARAADQRRRPRDASARLACGSLTGERDAAARRLARSDQPGAPLDVRPGPA